MGLTKHETQNHFNRHDCDDRRVNVGNKEMEIAMKTVFVAAIYAYWALREFALL